jgi:protein-tyrosine phosphatase
VVYLTSTPLRIDFAPSPWLGQVGMSACPGAGNAVGSAESERRLALDVAQMAAQDVKTVVSLLDTAELQRLGAANLPYHLGAHGITWQQLPVVDFGVPSVAMTARWIHLIPQLTHTLQTGNILIHCAHGKGRTGTLAATLFKAWGWGSEAAVAQVRQYRLGAIETHEQEAYIAAFEP